MVTQFLRTRVGTWKEGWVTVCKITLAPCCSCISQSTEWTQTTTLIKSVTIRKWAQGVYQIRGWQKRSQFYTCSLSALMVRGTGAELETVMTAHHHAWKPFKKQTKNLCMCVWAYVYESVLSQSLALHQVTPEWWHLPWLHICSSPWSMIVD